jgi:hypothetical protein
MQVLPLVLPLLTARNAGAGDLFHLACSAQRNHRECNQAQDMVGLRVTHCATDCTQECHRHALHRENATDGLASPNQERHYTDAASQLNTHSRHAHVHAIRVSECTPPYMRSALPRVSAVRLHANQSSALSAHHTTLLLHCKHSRHGSS